MFGGASSVRGLRDVGNGGNDTAGSYGFVINSAPDKVIIDAAQLNPDPMYPKIDVNDERSLLSHKGLHAFLDTTWTHQPSSEFRSDIDTVKYIDDFAGTYSSNLEPWQLVTRLAYTGVVRNDVLRDKGAAKDNTLDWSAKRTSRHTGTRTIMAGQYVYWDLPSKADQNGALDPARGAAHMADMPDNASPAMTMPYDPILHKGTPTLIKRALGINIMADDPDNGRFNDPRYTEYGLFRQSQEWIDAVIRSAIVLTKSLQGVSSDAVIQRMMAMVSDKTNADRVNFTKAYIDPLGDAISLDSIGQSNFLLKDQSALPKLCADPEHDRKMAVTGTVFQPNSDAYRTMWGEKVEGFEDFQSSSSFDIRDEQEATYEKTLIACQLTAAEDLFYFTALINGFYTNRIIELPLTSADPGRDYDSVPVNIIGPS